jgi:hypothetical protein
MHVDTVNEMISKNHLKRRTGSGRGLLLGWCPESLEKPSH